MAEAMESALPILVALVADELPIAAHQAGVDVTSPELRWSLAAVGRRPATDDEVAEWWSSQR